MQYKNSRGKSLSENDNQSGRGYNNGGKRNGKFKSFVKDLDIYARPVNMTFRGRDKFYSLFGGFVSLILLILILVVFFFKLNDVINFNQTQIKKNTLVSISNSYTPPQSLSEKNITIAFMLSDFWGENVLDDPRYGKFKLSQFINYITPEGRIFTNQPIPFSKCKYGVNFFYHSYDEIKDYGIENYFCPDLQNLTLQGNWHAPVFAGIVLDWQRCSQDKKSANYYPGCVNDTVFKEWFREATLQEIAISSYFDGNDYQNPIRYYLDDMWVSLQYGRSVIYDSFFKKNIIQLTDDQYGFFSETKEDHFFQRSKADYFTSDDEKGPGLGNYLHQAFKLDKEYDIYERNVYTISGVLQDVGGIYNSLFFIGLIIYTYSQFQHTLFFAGIISKIYMVEDPEATEGPDGKTLSSKGSKVGKEQVVKIQHTQKLSDKFQTQFNTSMAMGGKIDGVSTVQKFKVPPASSIGGDMESAGHTPKPRVLGLGGGLGGGMSIMQKLGMAFREKVKDMVINDLTKAANGDGKVQESTVQKLKDYLFKTRQPLSFSVPEIIKISFLSMFSPVIGIFQNKPTGDQLKKKKHDKVTLFQKGEEQVMKELDCVSFLHRMRNLELLMKLLFTSKQRLLLALQKRGNFLHVDEPAKNQKPNSILGVLGEDSDFSSSEESDDGGKQAAVNLSMKLNPSLGIMRMETKKSTPLERALRSVASKSTGSNSSQGGGGSIMSDIDMKLLYGLVSAKKKKIPKTKSRHFDREDASKQNIPIQGGISARNRLDESAAIALNDTTLNKTAGYELDDDIEDVLNNVNGGGKVKGILRAQKGQEAPFKQSFTAVSQEWNKLQMGPANGSGSTNGVKWQDNIVENGQNPYKSPGLNGNHKKGSLKQNSDMIQHSELDKSEMLSD